MCLGKPWSVWGYKKYITRIQTLKGFASLKALAGNAFRFVIGYQNLQAFEGLASCAGKPWSVWGKKENSLLRFKH